MIDVLEQPSMLDVSFAIRGGQVARDNAFCLSAALRARLPWLAEDFLSGVHPLKVVAGSDPLAMLSTRTRLWLRVRRQRASQLESLCGSELDLGGQVIRLGDLNVREFVPHGTLYAYRVAADSDNEVAFMTQVTQLLQSEGISGQTICGRHHQISAGEAQQHVFSLMVHGLDAERSQHLQHHGLGPHRLLGCGLFVPHKSASAV
jgi:CRISPR-associated protein Cas6